MLIRLVLLPVVLMFFCPPSATAALAPAAVVVAQTSGPTDWSRTAVAARLGRKLTLKERFALSVLRRRARRHQRTGAPVGGGKQLDSVSLIAGILGILTFLVAIPLPFVAAITGLAALILGVIGLGRTPRDGFRGGKGWAITGLAVGGAFYLAILLLVLAIVIFSM